MKMNVVIEAKRAWFSFTDIPGNPSVGLDTARSTSGSCLGDRFLARFTQALGEQAVRDQPAGCLGKKGTFFFSKVMGSFK